MLHEPYIQPIGLGTVAAVLLKEGHTVQILDYNTIRCEDSEIVSHFPDENFDWIGISGLITTYKYLVKLVPLLRERYSCPLVIGGGGITSAPEVYMENLKPDFGVLGEGEETVIEFCEELGGNQDYGSIKGLIWAGGKNPPRPPIKDLDSIPMQAYDLIDMNTYLHNVKYAKNEKMELALMATRGCPFSCVYCYHIFGRSFRYRNPKLVVDEIEYLKEAYGVRSFLFTDECITANKKNLLSLCKEIVERGVGIGWVCYSRADTIDEEMLYAMKDAGCQWVGYGFESGSQRILDEMNKGVTLAQMESAYKMTKRILGNAAATFIFGMPGEDDDSIWKNITFAEKIKYGRTYFHLAPYPGTKVFEDNKEKILDKFGTMHNFIMNLDDAGKFVINLTEWDDDTYFKKKEYLENMGGMAVALRIASDRNRKLVVIYKLAEI
jgi:radical SAM superfamily enzyme YgiQ (UPF0313 family)